MKKPPLVVTLGEPHDKPWWWRYVTDDISRLGLEYQRLVYRNKRSQNISTAEIPIIMLMVLRWLLRWRKRYEYIFTFECDLIGFSLAFWQSLLRMSRPKHVILQFIMREKTDSFKSRAKYALMRFLFSSVQRIVVSANEEVAYYKSAFTWEDGKISFVPMHTTPELLERKSDTSGNFFLAAGRSFRDYETLVAAVRQSDYRLVIVGGTGARQRYGWPPQIDVRENIPLAELECLMAECRAVIVPLEDRPISTGQSIILSAMALGKAVVATRTVGTIDYITHLEDGLLVEPGSPEQLLAAMRLLDDPLLLATLGKAARKRIMIQGLPDAYCRGVEAVLCKERP